MLFVVVFSILTSLSAQAADLDEYGLALDCEIGGLNAAPCRIDTGGGITALTEKFAGLLGKPSENAVIELLYGRVQCRSYATGLNIKLKDIHTKNIKVLACPWFNSNNIGIDFFKDGSFIFDFKSKIQSVKSVAKFTSAQVPYQMERARGGQILIPVTMGGKTEYALWDTGAGGINIDVAYVREHPEISDNCRNSLVNCFTPGIFAGGQELENSRLILTMDFSVLKKIDPRIVFLIGPQSMKSYIWKMDLKNNRWFVQ